MGFAASELVGLELDGEMMMARKSCGGAAAIQKTTISVKRTNGRARTALLPHGYLCYSPMEVVAERQYANNNSVDGPNVYVPMRGDSSIVTLRQRFPSICSSCFRIRFGIKTYKTLSLVGFALVQLCLDNISWGLT